MGDIGIPTNAEGFGSGLDGGATRSFFDAYALESGGIVKFGFPVFAGLFYSGGDENFIRYPALGHVAPGELFRNDAASG